MKNTMKTYMILALSCLLGLSGTLIAVPDQVQPGFVEPASGTQFIQITQELAVPYQELKAACEAQLKDGAQHTYAYTRQEGNEQKTYPLFACVTCQKPIVPGSFKRLPCGGAVHDECSAHVGTTCNACTKPVRCQMNELTGSGCNTLLTSDVEHKTLKRCDHSFCKSCITAYEKDHDKTCPCGCQTRRHWYKRPKNLAAAVVGITVLGGLQITATSALTATAVKGVTSGLSNVPVLKMIPALDSAFAGSILGKTTGLLLGIQSPLKFAVTSSVAAQISSIFKATCFDRASTSARTPLRFMHRAHGEMSAVESILANPLSYAGAVNAFNLAQRIEQEGRIRPSRRITSKLTKMFE